MPWPVPDLFEEDNVAPLLSPFAPASSGGVSDFLGLTDTPAVFTGHSGKSVVVKSSEDGLEFTTVAAGGSFSIFDILNGLSTRHIEVFDYEWMDAHGTKGTSGTAAITVDHTNRDIELATGATAGSVASLYFNLSPAVVASGGFSNAYTWGTAGTFYIAVNFTTVTGGLSGSNRPIHSFGVTATARTTLAALAAEGFEFHVTGLFGSNTASYQHDGTTLTSQAHNFGIDGYNNWLIFKHVSDGTNRTLDTVLAEQSDGGGEREVHAQQTDKHYSTSVAKNAQFSVVVGNNSKSVNVKTYIKQVIIASSINQ